MDFWWNLLITPWMIVSVGYISEMTKGGPLQLNIIFVIGNHFNLFEFELSIYVFLHEVQIWVKPDDTAAWTCFFLFPVPSPVTRAFPKYKANLPNSSPSFPVHAHFSNAIFCTFPKETIRCWQWRFRSRGAWVITSYRCIYRAYFWSCSVGLCSGWGQMTAQADWLWASPLF